MKAITWWKARLWWVRWIACVVASIACVCSIEDLRAYLAALLLKVKVLTHRTFESSLGV